MYDPSVGRFLSEDTMRFEAGDPNLYRYVANNATNATDPSGMYIVAQNAQAKDEALKMARTIHPSVDAVEIYRRQWFIADHPPGSEVYEAAKKVNEYYAKNGIKTDYDAKRNEVAMALMRGSNNNIEYQASGDFARANDPTRRAHFEDQVGWINGDSRTRERIVRRGAPNQVSVKPSRTEQIWDGIGSAGLDIASFIVRRVTIVGIDPINAIRTNNEEYFLPCYGDAEMLTGLTMRIDSVAGNVHNAGDTWVEGYLLGGLMGNYDITGAAPIIEGSTNTDLVTGRALPTDEAWRRGTNGTVQMTGTVIIVRSFFGRAPATPEATPGAKPSPQTPPVETPPAAKPSVEPSVAKPTGVEPTSVKPQHPNAAEINKLHAERVKNRTNIEK